MRAKGATIQTGGNWSLGAQQTEQSTSGAGANGVYATHVAAVTGSTVKVCGVSQIGLGGDLTATGAALDLSRRHRRGKRQRQPHCRNR